MRRHLKLIIFILLILLATGGWLLFRKKASTNVTYQTGTVTKGTLVVSVSASGQTESVNRIPVTTTVTGTVSDIYIQEGATVKAGQSIMKIDLDQSSSQALTKVHSAFLQAKNAVTAAQQAVQSSVNDVVNTRNGITEARQSKVQLQQSLLQARQNHVAAQQAYNAVANLDPSDLTRQQKYLALQSAIYTVELAKSKLDSADAAITRAMNEVTTAKQKSIASSESVTLAQTNLVTAQQAYDEASGIITASVGGTITDLTYAKGMILASSTSTAGASNGSAGTKVASIVTSALPTATFTVAEVDAPKVQPGQKTTLTFDALTDKTFTGTVIGIDRAGSVSSGVTTYPMTIQLDAANDEILPNMSVTADVITKTVRDVLLVPNAAVKTSNGTTTAQVMENNQPSSIVVEIGDVSDSQTVIISGLTEGQTVITATIQASTINSSTSSRSGTSLFSGSTIRTVGPSAGTVTGGFRPPD